MNKLSYVAACVLVAAFSAPTWAQQGAVVAGKAPGMAGVAQTVNVQAKITKIDAKTREVTLKGPQGNELTVEAGPEVKNFSKLKVGDSVDVQYVESLVLELKKGAGRCGRATRHGGRRRRQRRRGREDGHGQGTEAHGRSARRGPRATEDDRQG